MLLIDQMIYGGITYHVKKVLPSLTLILSICLPSLSPYKVNTPFHVVSIFFIFKLVTHKKNEEKKKILGKRNVYNGCIRWESEKRGRNTGFGATLLVKRNS